MLDVQDVTMRFGGLVAVDDASFTVAEGAIVGLIGPNGAGKTTLFAIIAGFLAPSAGRVRFEGEDITAMPTHRRAGAASSAPSRSCSPSPVSMVHENIAVGAYLRHASARDAHERAEAVAHRVGLGADARPAGRQR